MQLKLPSLIKNHPVWFSWKMVEKVKCRWECWVFKFTCLVVEWTGQALIQILSFVSFFVQQKTNCFWLVETNRNWKIINNPGLTCVFKNQLQLLKSFLQDIFPAHIKNVLKDQGIQMLFRSIKTSRIFLQLESISFLAIDYKNICLICLSKLVLRWRKVSYPLPITLYPFIIYPSPIPHPQ